MTKRDHTEIVDDLLFDLISDFIRGSLWFHQLADMERGRQIG